VSSSFVLFGFVICPLGANRGATSPVKRNRYIMIPKFLYARGKLHGSGSVTVCAYCSIAKLYAIVV
jgi:hypothetical protein